MYVRVCMYMCVCVCVRVCVCVSPAWRQFTSSTYSVAVNKYKAKSGQALEAWESSGWIRAQDPRGWFQWYCRFYLGRRSDDDVRQV
jgi:hypothetical protein